MRYWAQFRGVVLVLLVGVVFALVGMIIGSNLSIPDKLKAEPQRSGQVASTADIAPMNGHSPFVAVAEIVRPAVVNISAESVTEDKFHNFMDDDFFRRFFGLPQGQNSQSAAHEALGIPGIGIHHQPRWIYFNE